RVQLGFSWQLFDGGRRQGELVQLDSRREQQRLRLIEQRRQARAEVEQALVDLETGRTRRDAALQSAAATREAARVADESYRLGVALQADALDAADRAVRQQLTATRADFETRKAEARLKRTVGLMPTASLGLGDPRDDLQGGGEDGEE
ncbi:MAG: TolC family protein, partial [Acidobacteriota bacterium]